MKPRQPSSVQDETVPIPAGLARKMGVVIYPPLFRDFSFIWGILF